MDYEPPVHVQMPTRMIKLKSSDAEILEVEVKAAQLSLQIKWMLDDLGVEDNDVIPIPPNAPEISGAILQKIIQWTNHHKDDPAPTDENNDEKELQPTDDISSWDAKFLQVDQTTLFLMIRAANYLNIEGLLDATCKTVAKMIKGMSVEEIRQRFHIQNDFSPDEEEQVRRENEWCEGHEFRQSYDRSVNGTQMDKIPLQSMQHCDNRSVKVFEDCLGNSEIVRKIFQHFLDTELLQLSYVNKTWNLEARSTMKKRGTLLAKVSCTHARPFQEIREAFLAATRVGNPMEN